MSRAIELAKKCHLGFFHDEDGPSLDALEAFYHAARLEALKDAAVECMKEAVRLGPKHHPERALDCAEAIRAMADREGK